MTAIDIWQTLRKDFRSASTTAALDARLLLEHVLDKPLHQAETQVLSKQQWTRLHALVRRRNAGEPVARLFGLREFYGLEFMIDQAVLDPRPETELLVEQGLKHLPAHGRFLDLGTGSGCVAIALAMHSEAIGLAVDWSQPALDVAQYNAARHRMAHKLVCQQSYWADAVSGQFDVIVSNPPYIAQTQWGDLPCHVRDYDPPLALVGGADGLDCLRYILRTSARVLAPNGVLLLEHGHTQADAVQAIAATYGWHKQAGHRDLAGWPRVLEFVKKNKLDKA